MFRNFITGLETTHHTFLLARILNALKAVLSPFVLLLGFAITNINLQKYHVFLAVFVLKNKVGCLYEMGGNERKCDFEHDSFAVPSQAKFHCFYVVNSREKRVLDGDFSLRANVGGGVMSASKTCRNTT